MRHRRASLSSTLVWAAFSIAVGSGCGGEAERDPSQWPVALSELERGSTPADPGEAAYRRTCIACHGRDGRGNGGTTGADFGSATGPLTRPDDELLASIRDGKTGTIGVMPAHRALLTEVELHAVLAYVRRSFGADVMLAAAAAGAPADAGPDANVDAGTPAAPTGPVAPTGTDATAPR